MTQPEIVASNNVAWMVQRINDLYMQGKLKGLTVQMVMTDDEFATAHSGDLSYLEKLGLIEAAKQDLLVSSLDSG